MLLDLKVSDESVQRIVDLSEMLVLFEVSNEFPPIITVGVSRIFGRVIVKLHPFP